MAESMGVPGRSVPSKAGFKEALEWADIVFVGENIVQEAADREVSEQKKEVIDKESLTIMLYEFKAEKA
jgi:predicted protein tyrosine phosphatase